MSDVQVQMEGIVTPTYDKRRKGYKFKADGMEIFIKGADTDAGKKAAVDQMSRLLEQQKEKEEKEKAETKPLVFAEGGLKDEGGTVDPVSGNTVPSGSTQKEVRDDIPAQLSEGEFIFPADVVRYIGLENLMELRQKAKVGLARMEDMGQMGNSEEAIIDDSGEYNDEIDQLIDNFDPDDPEVIRFAEGGVVYAQQGAFVPGMPQQQFSYGFMPPPQQGFQAPGYSAIPSQPSFITSPARVAVGQAPVVPENRTYVGPDGTEIIIPFYDGKPMQGYVIPKGFKYKSPEEAVAEAPEVAQPVVTQPRADDGGDGPQPELSNEPRFGFGSYRSVEDMSNIFATINKDLANLKTTQKNRKQTPFFAVEIFNKVVDGIKEGFYTNEAVDQVRSGENLSTKPEGDYADWRRSMSTFMSAATLETENEAKDVSSKNRDIQGSSFASMEEANAVANNGWGSDAHFDAIEASFSSDSGSGSDGPTDTERSAASEDIGATSGAGTTRGESRDDLSGTGSSEDTFSSPFSEGGAVQEQTKRALKSSRKKK